MAEDEVVVAIATPLEGDLVAAVRAVDRRLRVLYEADLLPPTRYRGDHRGVPGFRRDAEEETRWQAMLGRAEVLFGLPGDSPQGLADAIRANAELRFVQGTAAGAGEQVRAAGLTDEELARVSITTASGVHAGPLAEFTMLGLLAFRKNLPRLLAEQASRSWAHHVVDELRGASVVIVGLGAIGTEVARLAKAFGMRTIGVNRAGRTSSAHVDEVHRAEALSELLPVADAVVLSLPLTTETKGLIDGEALSAMRRGVVLVNVGRGGVIDEAALVDALADGRVGGAALDVFSTEPLPEESLLWSLPNVLIAPHTAGLSAQENERIVDLFAENLRRYLRGDELLNRVRPGLFY